MVLRELAYARHLLGFGKQTYTKELCERGFRGLVSAYRNGETWTNLLKMISQAQKITGVKLESRKFDSRDEGASAIYCGALASWVEGVSPKYEFLPTNLVQIHIMEMIRRFRDEGSISMMRAERCLTDPGLEKVIDRKSKMDWIEDHDFTLTPGRGVIVGKTTKTTRLFADRMRAVGAVITKLRSQMPEGEKPDPFRVRIQVGILDEALKRKKVRRDPIAMYNYLLDKYGKTVFSHDTAVFYEAIIQEFTKTTMNSVKTTLKNRGRARTTQKQRTIERAAGRTEKFAERASGAQFDEIESLESHNDQNTESDDSTAEDDADFEMEKRRVSNKAAKILSIKNKTAVDEQGRQTSVRGLLIERETQKALNGNLGSAKLVTEVFKRVAKEATIGQETEGGALSFKYGRDTVIVPPEFVPSIPSLSLTSKQRTTIKWKKMQEIVDVDHDDDLGGDGMGERQHATIFDSDPESSAVKVPQSSFSNASRVQEDVRISTSKNGVAYLWDGDEGNDFIDSQIPTPTAPKLKPSDDEFAVAIERFNDATHAEDVDDIFNQNGPVFSSAESEKRRSTAHSRHTPGWRTREKKRLLKGGETSENADIESNPGPDAKTHGLRSWALLDSPFLDRPVVGFIENGTFSSTFYGEPSRRRSRSASLNDFGESQARRRKVDLTVCGDVELNPGPPASRSGKSSSSESGQSTDDAVTGESRGASKRRDRNAVNTKKEPKRCDKAGDIRRELAFQQRVSQDVQAEVMAEEVCNQEKKRKIGSYIDTPDFSLIKTYSFFGTNPNNVCREDVTDKILQMLRENAPEAKRGLVPYAGGRAMVMMSGALGRLGLVKIPALLANLAKQLMFVQLNERERASMKTFGPVSSGLGDLSRFVSACNSTSVAAAKLSAVMMIAVRMSVSRLAAIRILTLGLRHATLFFVLSMITAVLSRVLMSRVKREMESDELQRSVVEKFVSHEIEKERQLTVVTVSMDFDQINSPEDTRVPSRKIGDVAVENITCTITETVDTYVKFDESEKPWFANDPKFAYLRHDRRTRIMKTEAARLLNRIALPVASDPDSLRYALSTAMVRSDRDNTTNGGPMTMLDSIPFEVGLRALLSQSMAKSISTFDLKGDLNARDLLANSTKGPSC